MSTEIIDLADVGPIEHLAVPLPDGGGITVFRGRNDSGKSLSIGATERLCGGDVRLSQRDGAEEPGRVAGLGMTFSVGRTTRGKGELQATSIAGKLNIGDLIDPGIKDEKAADRARTKALCKLLGVEAKPELFHDALGGPTDFDMVVGEDALETDDVVEMQRRIKADCDKAARTEEDAAQRESGKAAALEASTEDVDWDVESDAAKLQAELEEAIKAEAALIERDEAAKKAAEAAHTAANALAEAVANYTGPSVEEAVAQTEKAKQEEREAVEAIEAAKAALKAAEAAASAAFDRAANAMSIEAGARSHATAIAGWEQTIDGGATVEPAADDINAAKHTVYNARDAVERGVRIRDAKKRASEIAQHKGKAEIHRETAETLRKAGKATEKVLSKVVEADTLTLKAGRWMTEHPDRGPVPYHERSRGTKAAIALDLAARRAREMTPEGMVVIPFPQEVWEGLDPDNRAKLAAQAKTLSVNLITAECAAGDVRCEVFGGNDA